MGMRPKCFFEKALDGIWPVSEKGFASCSALGSRNPQHLVEESDEMLPDKIVDDKSKKKPSCEKHVRNRYGMEPDQSPVAKGQEAEASGQCISRRGQDKWKKSAVKTER